MTAGWVICPWAHRSPEAEPGFEQSLTVTLSILEEFNSVVKLHPAPVGGQRRWWSQPSEECLCSVRSNSWTPWTAAHQAPLSMGFCRQESWSGLPCPCLGIFPIQGSTHISCIGKQILYRWATCEAPQKGGERFFKRWWLRWIWINEEVAQMKMCQGKTWGVCADVYVCVRMCVCTHRHTSLSISLATTIRTPRFSVKETSSTVHTSFLPWLTVYVPGCWPSLSFNLKWDVS